MGIEIIVKSLEEVVKVIILTITLPLSLFPSFPSSFKYIVLITSSKSNSY